MKSIHNLLQQYWLGNRVEDYLWFAGILISGILLKKYVSKLFSRLLYHLFKRYGKHIGIGKFMDLLSAPFAFFFMVLVVFIACSRLSFPLEWNLDPGNVFGVRFVLFQFFQAMLILAITWILIRVVEFIGLVISSRAARTSSKLDDQLVLFAKEAVKVLLAGIGFFIMLGVAFKLDVVSLVTGLGIGGLAVALAAKETLENLLGSFTIFLDKPFVVGDLVQVGNIEGRVEGIGFRSTRIRALDRMQVVVPNKKMVDAELINNTERSVHRVFFPIGLTYDTSAGQLKSLMSDLIHALNGHPMIEENPTVHFHRFGESSLEILVVFFVNSPDWLICLKVREEINFQLMELLNKNKCRLAFPSKTVYLKNEESGSGIN